MRFEHLFIHLKYLESKVILPSYELGRFFIMKRKESIRRERMTMTTEIKKNQIIADERYMAMALSLAKKGAGFTNPNPMVGAVIVKDGKIIGEGYHKKYGGPHAEVNAFADADERGENTKGATIYVTLEPCFHYGKTPPCVDLVLKKEVSRVVIGTLDPNPLVAGQSVTKMEKAGIEVVSGVLKEECLKLNEIFFQYVTTKKPFVFLKSALSLDGKMATVTGESQWISCEESRREVHELRGVYASIMVGIGTVLADNPSLTCRIEGKKSPIRIIVDSSLQIPLDANVLKNQDIAKTIIATTSKADKEKKRKIETMDVEVLVLDERDGHVDLTRLQQVISERKIDSVLLEGGADLAFGAIKAGIVDKVRYYIAPMMLGGWQSKAALGGEGFEHLRDAFFLENVTTRQIGQDICIEGYRKNKIMIDEKESERKCLQEL